MRVIVADLVTEVNTCLCKVGALSRALAVRTLQLELEYIYGCLEEEALDIGQGTQNPTFLLSRQVCLYPVLSAQEQFVLPAQTGRSTQHEVHMLRLQYRGRD